jgi:SAM-dependent methyltransferase
MEIKNYLTKKLKRTNFITAIVIGLIFILLVINLTKKKKHIEGFAIEGFSQESKFILKRNNDIYDDFYVDVYDAVITDSAKNAFEMERIIDASKMNQKSNVIDIGCGLGHHVNILKQNNIPATGLELSKSMIRKGKSHYNNNISIKFGNAMDSFLFEGDQFTHIMCMFYTFYYMPSQEAFLRNCNKWLRFNGYLIVHIVDRNHFHPIVPPSELFLVPTETFAKKGERITTSVVKFKGFKYEADFKEDYTNNTATFNEIFTADGSGKIRKNVHSLKIKSIDEYTKMFKRAGFKVKETIGLEPVGYHHQYIYILQKER